VVVSVSIVLTGHHTKNLIKNLEKMYTLDLHGYKIDETYDVVDSFLYDHKLYETKNIEIITGDSKVIKSVVTELAENYGFLCKPHTYNKEVMALSV